MNIAITIFIALFPALCWLYFYYKKDAKDPEPKKVIFLTFIMGAVAAFPFLALRYFLPLTSLEHFLMTGVKSIFLFAAFEEIAKLTASILVTQRYRKSFNQLIDGVVYTVTAALGFAFIENFQYFLLFQGELFTSEWMSLILFRGIGNMLAHTIFSGLAGLIWAYAVFSKKITPFHKKHLLAFEIKDFINREILSLHIIRRNILMAHPSRRGGHEKKVLVLEGLVLAALLHALFNVLVSYEVLGRNVTFTVVPLLIGGFLYILYLFNKKYNQKIFKVV